MELSTRARYAVEAVIDLALHNNDEENISLGSISNRISVSISYLEQLFAKLRRAGVVNSIKGPKGGYKLNKDMSEISILDIIVAVDEPLETRSCKGKVSNGFGCGLNNARCKSHDLWDELLQKINTYLGTVTLKDVVNKTVFVGNNSGITQAVRELQ